MQRNWGLPRTEVKSRYEAEVRNLDIVLIVVGGLAGAMLILWTGWALS